MSVAQEIIKDLLESKKLNSIDGYNEIKRILFSQIIVIPYMQKYPNLIVRYRRHNNGENYFENIADISYRTDVEKIKSFGRCNEPKQSIFYCNEFDYEKTGIVESVTVFRDKADSHEEIFTVGAWRVNEPLNLGVILPLKEQNGKLTELDEMRDIFEKHEDSARFDDLKIFVNFLAKEFTLDTIKDNSNYHITAAFTNYIKGKLPDLDGFMYASVKDKLEGINMALLPKTVDKKLKLVAAKKRHFKRTPGTNEFWEVDGNETKDIDRKSGAIHWK